MATDQQLAVKDKADSVRKALERMRPKMAQALPKHLTPERLLRVTMSALQANPKLLDCDRTSLFAAVLTAAQLGLEPDGVLGHAYLVPFRVANGPPKVQFIPGYKGLLTLARNSGDIQTIQAHEVCKGDDFHYAYGLKEDLHHVVSDDVERSWENVTHFYAYATFKDGGHIFEVMTRAQVEAIRDNSQGYKAFKAGSIKTNPWDPSQPSSIQMGRKTAIRRIANYLPLQVQKAAAIDAAYEVGKHARTDEYGEVIIDGESTEIEGTLEAPTNTAQAKLDHLAGAGGEQEEEQQASSATTKKKRGKKSTKKTPSEPSGDDNPPEISAGQLVAAIMKATKVEEVDDQLDLANALGDEEKAQVKQAADSKRRQLEGGGSALFPDET